MGMPHRGRLNVLAHVLQQAVRADLRRVRGHASCRRTIEGDGDVKYHLGYSHDHVDRATAGTIHLSLSPNPSHLEVVNPVVEGIVRAKQSYRGDDRARSASSRC